jgi:anti-sigma regulatory factor (Ser/Thr protein kinase)
VTHGRVAGRDFEVRLELTATLLRIDVTDTRTERRPPEPGQGAAPGPLAETGRGLMLVEALADRWSVLDQPVGKTVRAELAVPKPGG